jgi:glycosyltransferase involved in cell wall biosynthesis
MGIRVSYYPPITNPSDLSDTLGRIAWYFFPVIKRIRQVRLFCDSSIQGGYSPTAGFDPAIRERLASILEKCDFQQASGQVESMHQQILEESDVLMIWRMPEDPDPFHIDALIEEFEKSGRRKFSVDPNRNRNEGSFYLWFSSWCFPEETKLLLNNSRRAFSRLSMLLGRKKKAYVFGTGPSLAELPETDFSDGNCIVANSIVKNRKLLKRLDPRIIVAADPIFHAGCSTYAAEFRQHLTEVMQEYPKLWLVVPLRDFLIYRSILSPALISRTVAIPFLQDGRYNIDLVNEMAVEPIANVLTLFMLPLAASFHDEIAVAGCDGRPLNENKYFWTHDPNSQFNEQMQTIQNVHPAFFVRSYDDYYSEHCANVERAALSIESARKVVYSITRSYIPALSARANLTGTSSVSEAPVVAAKDGPPLLVSLNPDILGEYGHYLTYERKLERIFSGAGFKFMSICNTAVPPELLTSISFLNPRLTEFSYRIGNYQVNKRAVTPPAERIESFTNELRAALLVARNENPNSHIVCYFYYGSLFHAEVMSKVICEFPYVRMLINLEWLTFMDIWDDSFLPRWEHLFKFTVNNPRFRITLTSLEMQEDLKVRTGYTLPVAPHPSVTFGDEDFFRLRSQLPVTTKKQGKCNVLFPGLLRKEKGYVLTAKVIARLASGNRQARFQCFARDVREGKVSAEVTAAAESIAQTAKVFKGELSEAQFKEMLAIADIIVLPYQVEEFAKRTSGLIVDAMYLGVPVVVIHGTWLAGLARRYNFGKVVSNADPEEIAAAVEEIWNDIAVHRAKTFIAGGEWFKANNWKSLVGSILSGC